MQVRENELDSILSKYEEDETLVEIMLIHIYPKKLARNAGIQNSRFFKVVGYNTETKKKRNLGEHDDLLCFEATTLPVNRVTVFRDGSTILVFRPSVYVPGVWKTQSLFLSRGLKKVLDKTTG